MIKYGLGTVVIVYMLVVGTLGTLGTVDLLNAGYPFATAAVAAFGRAFLWPLALLSGLR